MIRVVIFDMGKVLVWFDNAIFFRKLAALAGIPEERVREAAHVKLELVRSFDRGDVSPAEFKERVCSALGLSMTYEAFYEIFNDVFTLIPENAEILRRLKAAGFKTVLLSNTDTERYAFLRRTFPELKVFDDYVLSYEVKLLKPEPGMYRETLRRAGAAPGECVFIDDMAVNIEAARALGIPSVHYARGTTDLEKELKALGLVF
ncbi:MAG: HAD family phosphatase [Candidatus Aminicenantes bacterium]|nr:HAD family phosphatase [Candidatus Aminicenantes bacterium]